MMIKHLPTILREVEAHKNFYGFLGPENLEDFLGL